jgi:hypothetical protein
MRDSDARSDGLDHVALSMVTEALDDATTTRFNAI